MAGIRDDYSGRWAMVTGAGDGIGRALALGFAREGMPVAVLDIRADSAQAVAEEVRALGVDARALAVDVADRDALVVAADGLACDGIVPSMVWANAGVGAGATVVGSSRRTIEWVLGVNILSVCWTAQAFGPRLKAAGGPRHFGVTCSTASLTDVTGPFTLYAASKQGTAGIAEAIAAELRPEGIGVTLLYPGLLDTGIWNAGRARPERFGGPVEMPWEVGATWRAAPGPEVLLPPLLETIRRGGGRCVVDIAGDARARFEDRCANIAASFLPWTDG
jgi:NAD(P)-dependent dehydrogenase (short-subunit alcohol dehydrogenase family)